MFKKIFLMISALVIFAFCFSCNKTHEEDYTYSIDRVWWTDSIDTNQDHYVQSKRLNFDLRIQENVTRTVNARVFYKLHDASSFTFYAFLGEHTANGSDSKNLFFIPIGNPNKELPRGNYDFKIEVYEAGNTRIEATTGQKDSVLLTMQRFEQSSNDKNYSINVRWSNQFDRSNNSFWRYAKLILNVDVDAPLTKNVYAKLYYKKSVETVYKIYHEFPNFSIYDQNVQDTVSCFVGTPAIELEHGTYDFKIELYESANNILVALADESTPELNDVKFESEKDDSYFYTISKVWWSDQVDLDGDTYTQFRKLNFAVEVDKNESRTIFAKIYYMPPDTSDYLKYDSTANFTITEKLPTNIYSSNIGYSIQLDSAKYNFLISIYEPTADTVEAFQTSVSSSTDTTMANQKFEVLTHDIKK